MLGIANPLLRGCCNLGIGSPDLLDRPLFKKVHTYNILSPTLSYFPQFLRHISFCLFPLASVGEVTRASAYAECTVLCAAAEQNLHCSSARIVRDC